MSSVRCSLLAASPCRAALADGCASLADVFPYAAAEGVILRIDGIEVQVRRPRANRPRMLQTDRLILRL